VAWLMIVVAGALEMVWSYSAKQANGWTNWGWSAVTVVSSLISFFLLTFALKSLPLGTAYAAWTGIGAVGSFAIGIYLLGESAGTWRIISAMVIVAGVIGLRLSGGSKWPHTLTLQCVSSPNGRERLKQLRRPMPADV
jgi:quaternary ammonium compound-resistance protein SugE